jgi:hypothetical protein
MDEKPVEVLEEDVVNVVADPEVEDKEKPIKSSITRAERSKRTKKNKQAKRSRKLNRSKN